MLFFNKSKTLGGFYSGSFFAQSRDRRMMARPGFWNDRPSFCKIAALYVLMIRSPSMFISISGILCTYFPMDGPESGYFLARGVHSDMNFLYFLQMNGYRRNNGRFCPYFYTL